MESTAVAEVLTDGKQRLHEVNAPEGLKSLAEAIILQSMEDLWNPSRRRESLRFFRGEGFRTCAEVAEMDGNKRLMILKMLADAGIRTKSSPLKQAN